MPQIPALSHRASLRRVSGPACALALAAVAAALQLAAEGRLDFRSQFSVFYLAVLASSLRWGIPSGVVATLASAMFAALYVLEPRGYLPWEAAAETTELLMFLLVAGIMMVLVERLRVARVRADGAAARLREEVAERRRAEEELARQRDHLEEIVRDRTEALEESHRRLRFSERMAAVGSLASGLAHDLGNLILPMQGHLNSLRAHGLAPKAAENAQAIGRCVEYLRSLASGLRLFSKDAAPGRAGEVTQPQAWLRDTAPFFHNLLPKQVALEVDATDDLPAISVAPHRLTQAVVNLIGNAKDALGERQGRVLLRVRDAGDAMVRLEVIDDGPGMSEEVRQRCLEPFFTTRRRTGTGLGLALVVEIARSAGGDVEVASAPGEGTRITMMLPAAAAAPPAAVAAAPARRTAAVSVRDMRMSAMAMAIIEQAGFARASADGNPVPSADLWIIEADAVDASEVRQFLDELPGSAVVTWGQGPPALAEAGAIVLGEQSPGALRTCVEALARESPAGASGHRAAG